VTELHDKPVVCAPMEFNRFQVPSNMTCLEYAGEFMQKAPGYINDLSATDLCEYCAFKVGDEFFEPLGLSWGNRWRDLGIFSAFVGSSLIILFLASKFLNYAKR